MKTLVALVRQAKAAAALLIPGIVQHIQHTQLMHPRMDAADNLPINTLSNSIRAIFGKDVSQQVAENMANGVNKFNREQFHKVVKSALGVNVYASEPWLASVVDSSVETNVALIQSIPEQLLPQVQALVNQAYNGGMRVEDLADKIFGRFDVAESRAKLIARDQVSKLNGGLTRLRQQNIGGEAYVWRTSLDERVRHTHAIKEGQTYRWDAPPADTGNPGDDYQCRCYAEMKFPAALDVGSLDTEDTKAVTDKWRAEREDLP